MVLTGIVTELRSGSEYIDKAERVTIRIREHEGDFVSNTITIRNREFLKLNERVKIVLDTEAEIKEETNHA